MSTNCTGVTDAVDDDYGSCAVWRVMKFHKPLNNINDLVSCQIRHSEHAPAGWNCLLRLQAA